MKSRTQGVRVGLMFILLFVSVGPAAEKTLLERLPAETVVCVRLNGFDQTLNQLDQFLMGATPIPVSLGMMAKTQLGAMLGNYQLQGINTQGTVAVFALFGAMGPTLGILVPVSDFEGFVGNSSSIQALETEGLYEMTGPQGKKLLVTDADGYALLVPGQNQAQLTALKQQLSGGGDSLGAHVEAAQKTAADKEPVWIFFNTAIVGKMAAPMIKGMMQQAQGLMAMMGQGGNMDPEKQQAALDGAGSFAETFCNRLGNETKYAAISLAPDAQKLGLNVHLQSVPATELAKSLTRSGAQRDKMLLNYLQDGAVLNLSGTLMSKLITQGLDAMAAACPAQGGENMEKIKALATTIGQQFKGSDALSIKLTPAQAPFVSVQYAAQVADGNKLREQVSQLAELVRTQLPENTTGFQFKSGETTQEGMPIDTAQWSVPDNKGPVKQVDCRMAYLGSFFVMTAGSDTEVGMQSLLGKTRKAGQPPQEVSTLLDTSSAGPNADVVAVMNLARLIQQVPQDSASAGGAPMAMPSQSGIVAQLNLDQGRADFGLTLPKMHLQEISQAVQMLMMQRMMKQQQPPREQTAPVN